LCSISVFLRLFFLLYLYKTPPTPFLIKKICNVKKGSSKGANNIVATISKEDLRKIAETKLPDLNA